MQESQKSPCLLISLVNVSNLRHKGVAYGGRAENQTPIPEIWDSFFL